MKVASAVIPPGRWLAGDMYGRATGIFPLLATWERHDHPSQGRMRTYLQELSDVLSLERIPAAEPLCLDLVVDVQEPSRLLRHYDLENYLTPVVQHLGWRRFFMARATKRIGGGSEISVGRVRSTLATLPPPWVQTVIDAGSGPTAKGWKERLRLELRRHDVLAPGPVDVDLAWRCSSERNWVMLWKPTGDAMGPILGEPDPRNPYNVADDRIVALTLHREVDNSLGHGIHVGLGWRRALRDQ